MKQLLVFLLICTAAIATAQQNFEGKIVYTASVFESGGSKNTMTMYFGKPGIRIEVVGDTNPEKQGEAVIINLDSGIVYKISPASKTYTSTFLNNKRLLTVAAGKKLAGFDTKPVLVSMSGFAKDLAAAFGAIILYPLIRFSMRSLSATQRMKSY